VGSSGALTREVQEGGTSGSSSALRGNLENSTAVRDSKQFSCTSSKSSGPQLWEVQAYKRGKYRLAKLKKFSRTNDAVQQLDSGSSGALTRQFREIDL
jgi:hypothetical protein